VLAFVFVRDGVVRYRMVMVGLSAIVTGDDKGGVTERNYIPLFDITAFIGAGILVVPMPDLLAVVADIGVRLPC
jgi:hypothetical protein